MCKVSVIVPIYNVEKYLDRCVMSILNQTLRDIEIILVDDGSPDRCPEICNDLASRYPNIRVIHKQNAGLGMACNTGIEAASGKYIAFVDSDDWVDEDYLNTVAELAVRYNADAVYSGIRRVDDNGYSSVLTQTTELGVFKDAEILDFQLDMIASELNSPTERRRQMSAKIVLYSRKIIEENNLRFKSERELISEDLLFNLDYLSKSSVVVETPQVFYNYFCNSSSISQMPRKDRFEKYKILREFLLRHYTNFQTYNNIFEERINKMFIGYVRSAMKQITKSNACFRDKYRMLSAICSDQIWKDLQGSFPVKLLPLPKRIVFNLTCYNHPIILYLLLRL